MRTLYFVIGASGSGKTAIMPDLKNILGESISVYDFDDIGVPANADKKWRQESTELWLQKLIKENNNKACLLGQMVLGEILACPSAKLIDEINICLLDVSDNERIQRLKIRHPSEIYKNMLNWAQWLRKHHNNPQWEQRVLKENCWEDLDFSVWDSLKRWDDIKNEKGHKKVFFKYINTTELPIDELAQSVADWINGKGFWTDYLSEKEVKFSIEAAICLENAPWCNSLLNDRKIKKAISLEKKTARTNDDINLIKSAFFEIRFAYLLYKTDIVAEYEYPTKIEEKKVDFKLNTNPTWLIELTSARENKGIKNSTRQYGRIHECITNELNDEIKRVQDIIKNKSKKFPKVTENEYHMIIVDMRGFNGGVICQKDDFTHIACGLFNNIDFNQRIHVIGFIVEKNYTADEFKEELKFFPNPKFFSRKEDFQKVRSF